MSAPESDYPAVLRLEEEARLVDGDQSVSLALTGDGPWQAQQPVDAQSDFERRAESRDGLPPRTAKSSGTHRIINDLVRRVSKSRLLLAAFVLLFAAGFALIWFTAAYRVVLIDVAYEDLARRGQLETELLQKDREWSAERIAPLRESVANADRRRVFLDYATLADWLRAERNIARSMDLEFTYVLSKHNTSRIPHVDEATVSVRLGVPQSHDPSAYADLMRFMREMIRTPWYVEITEASIDSDERGARMLDAELRIWVHDKVTSSE